MPLLQVLKDSSFVLVDYTTDTAYGVTPGHQAPRPRLRRFSTMRELIDLLVFIGAIYALVNLASVRFIVKGPSMEPTFFDDQFLIISRVHYLLNDPDRGDIIVFHNPENTSEDFIKRVIGLPGDTVSFQDQVLFVNGEELIEDYIVQQCRPFNCPDDEVFLDNGEYFVMGDNRNASKDSRAFGPITRDLIVGEVLVRYWPPSDFGLIEHGQYD